MKWTEIFC